MTDYKRGKMRAAVLDELDCEASPLVLEHVEAYLDAVEMAAEMRDKAQEISDDVKKVNLYLKYSGEMRRQQRAARDTLVFLGISGDKKTDKRRKPIPSL